MRLSINIRRILPAMLGLFLAASANADFMEMDLSPGDGLVTLDNDTGLEWLDLTATQGISFNAALASGYVVNDGFRHATIAEVEALLVNAGFITTDNANNPLNDAAAALMLDLMGCTQFCGTNFETGRGFAVSSATFTSRPNYHAGPLGGGAAVVSLQTSNKDLVDATAGHWLVRAAVQTVPEPGTLVLLGLGLIGLGLVTRKKQTG